jgi:SRSO17 transposase
MRRALDDAVVDPALLHDLQPRLEKFIEPFAACLPEVEQKTHARTYLSGLLSDLERKNVESIAYLYDQERLPLQRFIGCSPWDYEPLLRELVREVGTELGEEDAILVFDPSAHPKKGTESVGVQRQWCGRLGKVENCQVGIYLGYVTRQEHALVDERLYLPQSWTKAKKRRKKAGVPKEVGFRTRHQLALEMLDEDGSALPHSWVAGDDEMGRSTRFRRDLQGRKERYLLAVPCNTLVRDLDATPPAYCGHGPRPETPFGRVDRWAAAQAPRAWTTVEVRAGEKGPLVVKAMKARVAAKTDRRRAGPEEVLVVFQEQQADGTIKHDYCLSNADWDTPLSEFARVLKAEHRIEECLQRAKGEAGLSDYEVRTWRGWHHHQTLSLIATWFLTLEARRGKNMDARNHCVTTPLVHSCLVTPNAWVQPKRLHLPRRDTALATQRTSAPLSLEETQPLASVAT